jgi:hypothetical protein
MQFLCFTVLLNHHYTAVGLIVLPVLLLNFALTWFFVAPIPMAKVSWTMIKLLFTKPWALSIESDYLQARSHNVLLATHQAFNAFYFKHAIWGMNIVFFSSNIVLSSVRIWVAKTDRIT